MVQINTEGIFPGSDSASIYMENDPPTHVLFRGLGVLQVALSGDRSVSGLTGEDGIVHP